MALAYPEGEVFFKRNSLHLTKDDWVYSANDKNQFYKTFLIEYVTNEKTGEYNPSGVHNPRTTEYRYKKDTESFFVYERTHILHGRRDNSITRYQSIPFAEQTNWEELKQRRWLQRPAYVKVAPLELGNENEPMLFIDMTMPIRALYFPVSQIADEQNPDIATYVQVNLTHGGSRNVYRPHNNSWGSASFDSTLGLGTWGDQCLAIDIPAMYSILCLPRQLRDTDIWSSKALTIRPANWIRANGVHQMRKSWSLDFANLVSASFGVQLQWKPYTEAASEGSFFWRFFKSVTTALLGLIPYAGPMLSMAFNVGMAAILDPEGFKQSALNGDLALQMIEAAIGSAGAMKGKMSGSYKVNSPSRSIGAIHSNKEFPLLQTMQLGQPGKALIDDEPETKDDSTPKEVPAKEVDSTIEDEPIPKNVAETEVAPVTEDEPASKKVPETAVKSATDDEPVIIGTPITTQEREPVCDIRLEFPELFSSTQRSAELEEAPPTLFFQMELLKLALDVKDGPRIDGIKISNRDTSNVPVSDGNDVEVSTANGENTDDPK